MQSQRPTTATPTTSSTSTTRTTRTTQAHGGGTDSGSTLKGGAIMLGLAVVLGWLPIIGPAIAGFVGGRVVGGEKRALGIALLPAVLLALVVWLILSAFDLPIVGAIAGIGVVIAIAVQELPLLVGAWAGGSAADDPMSPAAV